jgi:hypothetical protein
MTIDQVQERAVLHSPQGRRLLRTTVALMPLPPDPVSRVGGFECRPPRVEPVFPPEKIDGRARA